MKNEMRKYIDIFNQRINEIYSDKDMKTGEELGKTYSDIEPLTIKELNISNVISRLLNKQIIKHGKLKFGNDDNGRIFIGFDENNEICSFKIFDNGEIEKLETIR